MGGIPKRSSGIEVEGLQGNGRDGAISQDMWRFSARLPLDRMPQVADFLPGDVVNFVAVHFDKEAWLQQLQVLERGCCGRDFDQNGVPTADITCDRYMLHCSAAACREQRCRNVFFGSDVFCGFFKGKTVTWEGCVSGIPEKSDGIFKINLNMSGQTEPFQLECGDILECTHNFFDGQLIQFEAVLKSQGGIWTPHVLLASHIAIPFSIVYSRNRKRNLQQNSSRSRSPRLRSHSASVPPSECVICLSAPCTHAFLPCGHRCVCEACANGQALPKCPICRTTGSGFLRIWDS